MKSSYKNNHILLILLVVIGGILRFWNLSSNPVSLNWDEVSHGYNAYSILKTGMDEWGNHFPLIFRAFGDYKLPVYIYLTVIPIMLFGLNAFAVRFISTLAGTLAILGIYLLVRELFPTKKHLPLFSAFLLTISPWHFFISRPALEANLALTLTIFGFFYLIRFINRKSSFLPTCILLGLSLHTYNTARVFVPLLLITTLFIFRSQILQIKVPRRLQAINILSVLFICTSLLLVGTQVISGEGSARYEKLKILSPSSVFQLGEARKLSTLPPLVSRMVYNRPAFLLTTFTKNYLGYFSPQFINQTWGSQFQFAIPGENLLTLPVYLLSILGIFILISKIGNNRSHQFILSWLLLAPIAGSLTIDPPQALRPNPMIPVLMIIASLGLFFLLEKIPKKYTYIVFCSITLWIIINFVSYLYKYNTEYKIRYSSSWQYGYSQVIDYIKNHSSEYEKIFMTKRYGEPHIFYSFFAELDPNLLQPGPKNIRYKKTDWFWTDKIGNVYFINDWQIPKIEAAKFLLESGGEVSTSRSLLITSPDHIPVNAHIIETINFLDGSPAFIITSIP